MDSPLRDKLFVGRGWVFDKLFNILDDGPLSQSSSAAKKPTTFVTGIAGCGKTALLTELCFAKNMDSRQGALSRRILAHHFCFSQNKRTLSITEFVSNIVSQISRSPWLTVHGNVGTSDSTKSDSTIDQFQLETDPDEVFRSRVLQQLSRVKDPGRNMFIVIDGLDENYETQLQCGEHLSGCSRTIAELLANHVDSLPPWVFLLCSSRRQSKGTLKLFHTVKKIAIDENKKSEVMQDFKQYMRARLDDTEPEALNDDVLRDAAPIFGEVHRKSNGCFLYMELVINGLSQSKISMREVKSIPEGLKDLYSWLCQRMFCKEGSFTKIRPIFSVLNAAQLPMTRLDISDALLARNCVEDSSDLVEAFAAIEPFLWKSKASWEDQTVQIFHHSFAEWLVDVKQCSQKFYCNPADGHVMLALSSAYFFDLQQMCGSDIYDIVFNLSRSQLIPPLNAHLLALWMLWIGIEPEKISLDGVIVGDHMCQKIISLASSFEHSTPRSSPSVSMSRSESLSQAGAETDGVQSLTEADNHGQTFLMRQLSNPTFTGAMALKLVQAGAAVNCEDMTGASPLCIAAKHSNHDALQVLISQGAEVNHRDYDGWTALKHAAWVGSLACVAVLLDHGAEVDLRDNERRTPLRAAAWNGCPEIVQKLVEAGAEVNQVDHEGQTPLMAAAYMGWERVVDLLLWHGAAIDHTDANGRTALITACVCAKPDSPHINVVRRLLAGGANINHQDHNYLSPLIAASYAGHMEALGLLLERRSDCDLELQDGDGRTALLAAAVGGHTQAVQLLLSRQPDEGALDPDGRTVFALACMYGHADLVRYLLKLGWKDISAPDANGMSPVHIAAYEGHLEVMEALVSAGCSVNTPDTENATPLIHAAREGHLEMVDLLVKRDALVDHTSASGHNALRVAALDGNATIVEYLLTAGADINKRDWDGRTTLYVLAQEDKLEMVRLFVEWQVSIDVKDNDGRSPLMVAAWQGHEDMCRFLISHGADVNCADSEHRSCIQMAAWSGCTGIIRLLCQHKADVDWMCSQGATALTVAAQEAHVDAMEVLLQFGANPVLEDSFGRSAHKMATKNFEVLALIERAMQFNSPCNSGGNSPANQASPHASSPTIGPRQSIPTNSLQGSPLHAAVAAGASPVNQSPRPTRLNSEPPPPPQRPPPRQPLPDPQSDLASRPFPSVSSESANSSLEGRGNAAAAAQDASLNSRFHRATVIQPQANHFNDFNNALPHRMQPASNFHHHLQQDPRMLPENFHEDHRKGQESGGGYRNFGNNNYVIMDQQQRQQQHQQRWAAAANNNEPPFFTDSPKNPPVAVGKLPPPVPPTAHHGFHPGGGGGPGQAGGQGFELIPDQSQHSLKRNRRNIVNQLPPTARPHQPAQLTSQFSRPESAGSDTKRDLQYIDMKKLQATVLRNAQQREAEERARKSNKRRRNLFRKVQSILSFRGGKTSQEPATVQPINVEEVHFPSSTPSTPSGETAPTNVFNDFNRAAGSQRGGGGGYTNLTKSGNDLTDKKSADYRRLVDLSHMRQIDPISQRSFRNYDRLGPLKAAGGGGGNYHTRGVQPALPATNVPTPQPPPPRKSYFIPEPVLLPPSREPPVPPRDSPTHQLYVHQSKAPELPPRAPRRNAHVFTHTGGMAKVVAENPQATSYPNNGALSRQNNPNYHYLKNYMNQKDANLANAPPPPPIPAKPSRLPKPSLETIQEPIGGTMETQKSMNLSFIPRTMTNI